MIAHSKAFLDSKDIQSVLLNLNSGLLSSGKVSVKLADNISDFLNRKYTTLHSSGSDALYCILKALGITKGDSVLVPNYICESVKRVILFSGANFILYDNSPNSWVSSIDIIQKFKNCNCKAVIINHTFGIRFKGYDDLDKLGIHVIEDCCHAFSPTINNKEIGTKSIASFYSFNSTKFISGGEGGCVTTNCDSLFDEIKRFKLDRGISDLTASLVLSQLSKVQFFINRRREIAEQYFEMLPEYTLEIRELDSLYFRFPIFTNNQSEYFKSSNVFFRHGVDNLLSCPGSGENYLYLNSLHVFNRTISIPIYPALSINEINIIIKEVKKYG